MSNQSITNIQLYVADIYDIC